MIRYLREVGHDALKTTPVHLSKCARPLSPCKASTQGNHRNTRTTLCQSLSPKSLSTSLVFNTTNPSTSPSPNTSAATPTNQTHKKTSFSHLPPPSQSRKPLAACTTHPNGPLFTFPQPLPHKKLATNAVSPIHTALSYSEPTPTACSTPPSTSPVRLPDRSGDRAWRR